MEHHVTDFSSARRIVAFAFSKARATLRGSRPVRGDSPGATARLDLSATHQRVPLSHNQCLICRCTASSLPRTCCVTTRLGANLVATHRPDIMSTRSKQPSRANAWPVACGMIMAFSFGVTGSSHAITARQ